MHCSPKSCALISISALILALAAPVTAQIPPGARRQQVTPRMPLPPQQPQQAPVSPQIPITAGSWTPIGPAPLAVETPPNPNDNFSGRIVGVAAHPTDANTIYIAAAGGGVWKTTNGGSTWSSLTDTQITLSMGAIAISKSNPSVIYAGTGEANNAQDSNFGRGILISTNAGATWTLTTGPGNAFAGLTTSQIAVDPTNASIAYAAMADFGTNGLCCGSTGVWKTTNGGSTWVNTTTSIDTAFPWSDVGIDPSNTSVIYAAHGDVSGTAVNGVYKSTDGGATWSKLLNGPLGPTAGRISIAIAPSNSQVIYATAENASTFGVYKVMRSDNGGSTFTDLTGGTPNYMGQQGWYDTAVIVDPSNSAIVYVTGSAGTISMLRSTNSGVTWTNIASGGAPNFASPHPDHHGIAFDANGKLLDGDDGGLFRLDNPTPPTWSDLNGNLNTIQFTGIGLHPTNGSVVLGGSQDNGTELYTGSTVWTETDGGDGGFAKFSQTNGNRAYHQAPVASFGNGRFFSRSDDTGNTWAIKTNGMSTDNTQNFYAPFSVDPGNGDRVLYGATHVWETTNGGDAWTAIGTAGTGGFNSGGNNVDAIGIAPSTVNTVYAATGGSFAGSSQIFVTTNHGTAWTEHDLPFGNGRVNDIQVDPANSLIAYAVVSQFANGSHVFQTTNGGTSWTNISGNLPNEPVWSLQIDPSTSPSTLYVGAEDGVYASTNLGTTWSRFGTGLPNAQAVQIELNKNLRILGVATHGRGAWEISLASGAPTVTSVNPINGSGSPQTFSVVYTDPLGAADISAAYLLFNSSLSPVGACAIYYVRGNNSMYLFNDAGNGFVSGSVTPGGAGSLSNSQCTISSGGLVTTSGNTLTLPVAITFAANFAGSKNVYGYDSGYDGLVSGWQTMGTWTGHAVLPPTVTSVTPINGSNATQTFSVVYTDPAGAGDLSAMHLLFNSTLNGTGACWIYYIQAANAMYLINDAGNGFISGSVTPGGAGSLSNSQCTISSGGPVTTTANTLTLPVAITFTQSFAGAKNVYAYAAGNDGGVSGWQNMGTWTTGTALPPTVTSVTPINGTALTQTFTAVYTDPQGVADISATHLLFNGTLNVVGACWIYYVRANNAMYLANDAGNGFVAGSVTPGAAGNVSNGQCTISSGGVVTTTATTLTLPVAITFTGTFTGSKNVYGYVAGNDGLSSGWVLQGTWTP